MSAHLHQTITKLAVQVVELQAQLKAVDAENQRLNEQLNRHANAVGEYCTGAPSVPDALRIMRKEATTAETHAKSLEGFQAEQWAWVLATFPGETSDEVFRHLKEELAELEKSQSDPEEMADVFLLLQCLASHHGVKLMEAARAKFEKCKARRWQKTEAGFRHVKEPATAGPEVQP